MTLRHRIAQAYLVCLFVYDAPLAHAQPAPCDKTDGKGLAACVEVAYPAKLTAGVSLETRKANLAFLRDRLIETARCAKVDAGLNCKRGNCNTLSLDFIAVREGGVTFGVDFAGHSDDVTRRLDLGWYQHGPPNYGYPTYKAYGPVSCIIEPPQPPPFDPAPLFNKLEQLEALLKQQADTFNTQIAALHAQVTTIEAALPIVDSRVFALETKPVPAYRCRGRIAFGIPVSCTVTLEGDP